MQIGLQNLTLPALTNVRTDKYNARLDSIVEMSELVTCVESMTVYTDLIDRLRIIRMLLQSKKCSDIAKASVESITYSTEVNIFSIIESIAKGIISLGKWVVSTIGKILGWIFKFFRRDIKDARNDIDDISNKVDLVQNDTIKTGISKDALTRVENIIKSHANAKNVSPDNASGMKVPEYKKQYFNKFNASVIDEAKVGMDGNLVHKINIRGGKVKDLHWQSGEDLKNGCDQIENCKKELNSLSDELKAVGGEVKDIVKFLENTKKLTDKDLEGKAPHVIDASCFCIIIVKDLALMDSVENAWGTMTADLKKIAGKYVEAKS